MNIEEKRLKRNEYMRKYYATHKEAIKETNKQYRTKNADKFKKYMHKYRKTNRPRIYALQAGWRKRNKDKIRQYHEAYAGSRPVSKGRNYAITTSGNKKVTYRLVYVPNHPTANKTGFVMEHRYVMELHIGRSLTASEVVHHINKDGLDNRIENLQLMTRAEHTKHHLPDRNDFGQFVEKL